LRIEAQRHAFYTGMPVFKVETTVIPSQNFRIIAAMTPPGYYSDVSQITPNDLFQFPHIVHSSSDAQTLWQFPWYQTPRAWPCDEPHGDIIISTLEASFSAGASNPQVMLYVNRGTMEFSHPRNFVTSQMREEIGMEKFDAQPTPVYSKPTTDEVEVRYDDLHWEQWKQIEVPADFDPSTSKVVGIFNLSPAYWPSHIRQEARQFYFFKNLPLIQITSTSDSRSRARFVIREAWKMDEPSGTGANHVQHATNTGSTIFVPAWKTQYDRLAIENTDISMWLVVELVEFVSLDDRPIQLTLWMNKQPVELSLRRSFN